MNWGKVWNSFWKPWTWRPLNPRGEGPSVQPCIFLPDSGRVFLQSRPLASWKHLDCGLSSGWSPFPLRLQWERRRCSTRGPLPTLFRLGPGFKFKNCGFLKMLYFLTFKIWYAVYVLLWIKFWSLWFANHCILFLFTFHTTSRLFQSFQSSDELSSQSKWPINGPV